MSRSRHEIVKGVFKGKSKKEIKEMISENDLDVEGFKKEDSI